MKKRVLRSVVRAAVFAATAAALLFSTASARAQEVTRMPEATVDAIGLDGGVDGAFVARAAYTRRVDLGPLPDARVHARFTLPFFAPDAGDWALDAGLRTTPFARGDLRVALAVGPVVRNTSNALYAATAFGAGATLLLGYEGPRWGLSAEGDYEQIFSAYVRQSELYRSTFYAGAKDGFYAMPGSTARAGLRGGARFGAVEIALRGGYEWTGRFHPVVPPFFATLGVSYAF